MSKHEAARARWRAILDEQRRGGMGVAEFCRRKAIPASSFFAWRRRLNITTSQGQPAFVPVVARPAEPRFSAPRGPRSDVQPMGGDQMDRPIEVHLPGGRWLSVARGFDLTTLCQLLALLQAREPAEREPA